MEKFDSALASAQRAVAKIKLSRAMLNRIECIIDGCELERPPHRSYEGDGQMPPEHLYHPEDEQYNYDLRTRMEFLARLAILGAGRVDEGLGECFDLLLAQALSEN